MRMQKLGVVLSWVAISLLVVVSLASAEPYFGLYAGAAFPFSHALTIGDFPSPGNLTRDLKIGKENGDTSGILGGKFGYFLEPLPFLGFELDAFNVFGPDFNFRRTRNTGVQTGVVGRPDLGSVPFTGVRTAPLTDFGVGETGEVGLTGVMLDVVGRLPLMRSQEFPVGRLHPYIGVGGGWVNARLDVPNEVNGGGFNDDSNTWGAQGLAGLRYFLSPNVALFAEGKYLYVPNVKFQDSGTRVYNDFRLATASGGISFHFPHRPPPPPPPPPPLPPPPPPPPPVAPPQAVIETIVLQSVHFEFDKSRLTPLGRRVLDEAAQKLTDNPRLSVVIEGNTDSIGTDLYNLGLGQRRAEVVMGYLVLRHQVDPKRMTPLSFGESRPIADNRTAEGRALNRRVEFKVLVR
jgi:outer membrane protein OmpA-like peptidoglycan-associated protein/opacity protein-like surface antigen